jgi:hypothetical protein
MHWFWRGAIAVVICLVCNPLIEWIRIIAGIHVFPGTWWEYIDEPLDFYVLVFIIKWMGLWDHLQVIALCLIAMVSWVALVRWTGHGSKTSNETRCRKCGYILRGISDPRCSECGEQI